MVEGVDLGPTEGGAAPEGGVVQGLGVGGRGLDQADDPLEEDERTTFKIKI